MKNNLLILICLIGLQKVQSQTNWELLNPKPTANTGIDIHFVSVNLGYIITSNELLETIDSGISWQKKRSIVSGNDMSFVNSTGFIVGDGGYVLKSVDNGISWIEVSTGFNDDFNTVNLIDDSIIIISGPNSIVQTKNRGDTWERLPIPDVVVKKSFFVNSLTGHVACENGTILKTIDGGKNWFATLSSVTTPSDFFTIYFVNENFGFSSREHGKMFRTTDAGESWTEVSGIGQAVFDFHFLNENIGFVTGYFGATFKTIDSGITWTPILFLDAYYDDTSMYGIYFHDINNGYATGARGRIVRTIDGGETWSEHSPSYRSMQQIQFTNKNVGFVLIGNSFLKTIDGGENWQIISGPITSDIGISNFHFVNENVGYVNHYRSVYKTIDGGVNWLRTNNDQYLSREDVYAVDFINENVGFVSNYDPNLFKTEDGGESWQVMESPFFIQIKFLNLNIGFARGTRIVYKTIDGGNTWIKSFESSRPFIKDINFLDENNGFLIGDDSLIHKTTDGGTSWQKLTIPYGNYVQVKFYSKNVGYISNEDGNLYKTIDGGISWEYLTTHYKLNSIDIISKNIFTAGHSGKIFKSDVEYPPEAEVLSLNEFQSSSLISIYPNPAREYLNVILKKYEKISSIEIYDMTGKIIYDLNKLNSSKDIKIDISNLNTGLYFINVVLENKNAKSKFIKVF